MVFIKIMISDILGFSMEAMGTPWDPMGTHGNPWIFHENSWRPRERPTKNVGGSGGGGSPMSLLGCDLGELHARSLSWERPWGIAARGVAFHGSDPKAAPWGPKKDPKEREPKKGDHIH